MYIPSGGGGLGEGVIVADGATVAEGTATAKTK